MKQLLKTKMNKIHICLFLCVFAAFPATPQTLLKSVDRQLIDSLYFNALSQRTGYLWLEELCKIGPRLSGSLNSERSLDWAMKKFSGMTGTKARKQPITVPYWDRGNAEFAEIISGSVKRTIKIASLGGSISTPPGGITAQVIEVTSFEDLQAKGGLVNGKIVFFNVPFSKTNLNTFTTYGQIARNRVFGAQEAAKLGAVGTILRSITSRDDNVPHVGVMIYSDTIKKIPSVVAGIQDADYLHNALLNDNKLSLHIRLDCAPVVERPSANIIAEIKGSEKPDEIIVMSGHFDSWDKGQGAHDDGAGVIHSMESLWLLQSIGYKPKHTIRCVLFMNEENGSRGSAAYADSSNKISEKHLAAIESDRGGFLPLGFNFDGDSTDYAKILALTPELERWNLWYFRKGGSGADVGRLKNCRMKLGYVPDSQRYFDVHHSDNDVIEAVNPRELELGSAANAMMLYLLDNLF